MRGTGKVDRLRKSGTESTTVEDIFRIYESGQYDASGPSVGDRVGVARCDVLVQVRGVSVLKGLLVAESLGSVPVVDRPTLEVSNTFGVP